MKRLLLASLIITPLLTACSPESGVSEEGIQACIRESGSKSFNEFAAKKFYETCLKTIDDKLEQEKERRAKYEKERNRREMVEYERKQAALKREAEELIERKEKHKNLVLESRDKFVEAGWKLLGEDDKYWLLIDGRQRIGFSHVIQENYYLPKDEEPFYSPDNYYRKKYSNKYKYNKDPSSFIVNCDSRKHTKYVFWLRLSTESKADYIRTIRDRKWKAPYRRSDLGYLATDYACEVLTEEGKKSDAISLVIRKYDLILKKRLEGTGANPAYMAWDNGDCKVTVKAGTHQPETFSAMDWYEVDVCKRNVVQIDLSKRQ